MSREASADGHDGISVGGLVINAVRYADGEAVVSDSQQGLQRLMNSINKVTKDFDMNITVKTTQVITLH